MEKLGSSTTCLLTQQTDYFCTKKLPWFSRPGVLREEAMETNYVLVGLAGGQGQDSLSVTTMR